MRSRFLAWTICTLTACGGSDHDRGSLDDAFSDAAPGMLGEDDEMELPGRDAGGDGDAADSEVPAPDAGSLRAEILSPASGTQYYAFEDVALRGACHPALGLPKPSVRFVNAGANPMELGSSLEITRRFEVGTHRVKLVCHQDYWEWDVRVESLDLEDSAEIELTVLPTPNIVYGANGTNMGLPGPILYTTTLDQLGQATRISPENRAFSAHIFDYGYNSTSDRVFVAGLLTSNNEQVFSLVTPCREAACEGDELPYEEPVPEAASCTPGEFLWAPDGRAAFASFQCGVHTKSLYWIDLSAATPEVLELPVEATWADGDGRAAFTGNGDVLVYQTGSELKAMDARDDAHPVVSLGSVAGASWALSPPRDRLVILGADELFTLQASELIADGADARVELPFTQQNAREPVPLANHLVYKVPRVEGNVSSSDVRMMRWDGSHDAALCENCGVSLCNDLAIQMILGQKPVVKRLVLGASADLEDVAIAPDAPGTSYALETHANCSLLSYATSPGQLPRILVDLSSGEWVVAEAVVVAPSGEYVVTREGEEHALRSVTRGPLSLSAPSVTWTGRGLLQFSPDSEQLVFQGKHGGVEGTHHVALASAEVTLIPDFAPRSFRFSADGSKLLGHTGAGSTKALSEVDLTSLTVRWKTENGSADWGMMRSAYEAVPGARAVSYLAMFTADEQRHVFRSELSGQSHDFGISFEDAWAVSPDGTRLGLRDAEGFKLWSFDGSGASLLAQKDLPPLTGASFTFEVSAEGMFGSDTDMGETFWLANDGQVRSLSLPLGTKYIAATRGPTGASRGVLQGNGDGDVYSMWIDFADPSAPARIDGTDLPPRLWYQSEDRRFQLRGSVNALQVIDLVDAQSRAVLPADASIPVPSGDYVHSIVGSREGQAALLVSGTLFWLDLHTGSLTASQSVGQGRVADGNADLSRVVFCKQESTYAKLISVTPGGESSVLHDQPEFATTANCPYEPGYSVSSDGRWVYIAQGSGAGLLASIDGSHEPIPLPAGFKFRAFDRTGRFVLGVQRRSSPQEKHKIAVWSPEHPEQVLTVSPADFAIYEHETPIWVP